MVIIQCQHVHTMIVPKKRYQFHYRHNYCCKKKLVLHIEIVAYTNLVDAGQFCHIANAYYILGKKYLRPAKYHNAFHLVCEMPYYEKAVASKIRVTNLVL